MVPFLKSSLFRKVLLPVLLAAGAFGAAPVQAGGVQWSIGIQLPAPIVVYPAPQRVYAPAPVYVRAAPEVVYVEAQRPWPSRHHHRHWRDDDRWDRGDGDRDRWQDDRGGWRHGR
ncbi:MAG: hypothetical protein RLZZ373_1298 [Pseudomonadota bacterium]|jgi:hypothetical protein